MRQLLPALLYLLLNSSVLAAATYEAVVIKKLPHSRQDFTQGLEIRAGKLYQGTGQYGKSELQVFDLDGQRRAAPQLEIAGIGQIIPWGEGVLLRSSSYLAPSSWLLSDGTHVSRHPLSSTSTVDFSAYKVVREFATSLDGTQVPVNIILGIDTRLDAGSTSARLSGHGFSRGYLRYAPL